MDDYSTPITELAVSLARMEGKIDAYAARTSAVEEKVAEHDARLRETASAASVAKLDERLDAHDRANYVTPKGLFVAIAGTIAALAGLAGLVNSASALF